MLGPAAQVPCRQFGQAALSAWLGGRSLVCRPQSRPPCGRHAGPRGGRLADGGGSHFEFARSCHAALCGCRGDGLWRRPGGGAADASAAGLCGVWVWRFSGLHDAGVVATRLGGNCCPAIGAAVVALPLELPIATPPLKYSPPMAAEAAAQAHDCSQGLGCCTCHFQKQHRQMHASEATLLTARCWCRSRQMQSDTQACSATLSSKRASSAPQLRL